MPALSMSQACRLEAEFNKIYDEISEKRKAMLLASSATGAGSAPSSRLVALLKPLANQIDKVFEVWYLWCAFACRPFLHAVCDVRPTSTGHPCALVHDRRAVLVLKNNYFIFCYDLLSTARRAKGRLFPIRLDLLNKIIVEKAHILCLLFCLYIISLVNSPLEKSTVSISGCNHCMSAFSGNGVTTLVEILQRT
jgi:hypothetical protein